MESDLKDFGPKLGKAIVAFFAAIFSVFVLPWNIWTKSMLSLAEKKEGGFLKNLQKSELPLLNFWKTLIEAIIFISWFLGVLVAIYMLISGGGVTGFLAALVGAYMVPLYLAIFREMLHAFLVRFEKIVKIEENTRK